MFIDDLSLGSTKEFARLYKQYAVENDLCFVIMERDEIIEKLDDCCSLKLVADGRNHYLEGI
jgi:hypothetical protein